MKHFLNLYRDDFVEGIWRQICEQLDIPITAEQAEIVFQSVDFK
jgi:hypothetical protein